MPCAAVAAIVRCRAVPAHQIFDIEPADVAVLDHPFSADHDPIRPVTAT